MSTIRITSLGNAGILLKTSSFTLAVDPYFPDNTGEADVSTAILDSIKIDGFLVSHDHWDHFDPDMLARFASKYDSWIMGPGTVIKKLHSMQRELRLIQIEPAVSQTVTLPSGTNESAGMVTVFRTPHGRVHVSFLVEVPEGRFYFDADNHNTRVLPVDVLKRLDALFIYPWKQSGWREFVHAVNPAFWFLVHLSKKEMEEFMGGKTPSCVIEPITQKPVILCPGESRLLGNGHKR